MAGEGLINSVMGTSRLLLPVDRQGNTSLPHYSPDDFITICHEIITRLKENFFPVEENQPQGEAPKQEDGKLFCTILTSPRVERWMANSPSESGASVKKALKDWGLENGVKLHIRLSPALRETGMLGSDLLLFALPDIPDIIGDGKLHETPQQNSPVNEIGTSKIKIHAAKQEEQTILRKMQWQVTGGWNIVSWGNAVMEIPVTEEISPDKKPPPPETGFEG
ncbi:l-lactate dehydrogenase 3 [Lasius niger]|uniref:L-lactate dehydrogenase 3 n=1 Tax=Lasius niger TaxID=67767 RepID=A0A0J7KVQ3_LASNI|nr:l-lactate dehydrogenase 3 [Lasius niger]